VFRRNEILNVRIAKAGRSLRQLSPYLLPSY
jgi:hypothetical protein